MKLRQWTIAVACAGLSACGGSSGGGGGGSGGADPFTAAARTFQVDGSEEHADLGTTDHALAATLAALSVVRAVNSLGIAQFDNGTTETHTDASCDAGSGSIDLSIGSGGAPRTYRLSADQCFIGSSDLLFDGVFTRITTVIGNPIQGTLTAGSTASPAQFVVRVGDAFTSSEYVAADSAISFSGDASGSPFTTTMNGAFVLSGAGGAPAAGAPFSPSRWFEAELGTGGDFAIQTTGTGTVKVVTINGPLSVRSTGLSAACTFGGSPSGASYDVTTNAAITVLADGTPTNGSLTITSDSDTANVIFLTSGEADVTVNGDSQVYTPAMVAAFCGL